MTQVHQIRLVHIALTNLNLFNKVAFHGAGGAVTLLQLTQHFFQRTGKGGGGDQLIVHIQRVAVFHQTQLVGKCIAQLVRSADLRAGNNAGFEFQQLGVHSVAFVAQRFAGDLLHLRDGQQSGIVAAYRAQLLTVITGGDAQRVQRQQHGHRGHAQCANQKNSGMHVHVLKEGTALAAGVDRALAAAQNTLAEEAAHARHAAPQKQNQLADPAFRFGNAMLTTVADQRLNVLFGAADRCNKKTDKAGLNINVVPVRMLAEPPDQIFQLLVQLSKDAAVLRSGRLLGFLQIFVHVFIQSKGYKLLQMVSYMFLLSASSKSRSFFRGNI